MPYFEGNSGDLVRMKADKREGWVHEIYERGSDEWRSAAIRAAVARGENISHDNFESDDEHYYAIAFTDGNLLEVQAYDFDVVTPEIYVNVYLHDRYLGGHEEGGWWYDGYNPERSFRCRDEAHATQVFEEVQKWATEENANRRSDVSSVLSEGRYEVRRETHPPERYPASKPQYS